MTVHNLPSAELSSAATYVGPPRSGLPWADDDYETLIRLCGEGASAAQIARALGRSEGPVVTRAKRLLPIDERGMPEDGVLSHLRACVQAVDNYDWRTHLVASPRPRPIVNKVLPQPKYAGVRGLEDQQLVAIAMAVAAAPAHLADGAVFAEIRQELASRSDYLGFQEAAARALVGSLCHGSLLSDCEQYEPDRRYSTNYGDPTYYSEQWGL